MSLNRKTATQSGFCGLTHDEWLCIGEAMQEISAKQLEMAAAIEEGDFEKALLALKASMVNAMRYRKVYADLLHLSQCLPPLLEKKS